MSESNSSEENKIVDLTGAPAAEPTVQWDDEKKQTFFLIINQHSSRSEWFKRLDGAIRLLLEFPAEEYERMRKVDEDYRAKLHGYLVSPPEPIASLEPEKKAKAVQAIRQSLKNHDRIRENCDLFFHKVKPNMTLHYRAAGRSKWQNE